MAFSSIVHLELTHPNDSPSYSMNHSPGTTLLSTLLPSPHSPKQLHQKRIVVGRSELYASLHKFTAPLWRMTMWRRIRTPKTLAVAHARSSSRTSPLSYSNLPNNLSVASMMGMIVASMPQATCCSSYSHLLSPTTDSSLSLPKRPISVPWANSQSTRSNHYISEPPNSTQCSYSRSTPIYIDFESSRYQTKLEPISITH